jgi:hypothetical protein
MDGESGSEDEEYEERPRKKIVMNAGVAELMQKVDKLHKGVKEIEELNKKNKEQDEKINQIYEKFEIVNELAKNLTHIMDKKMKTLKDEQNKFIKNEIYDGIHDKVTLKLFNSEMEQMVTLREYNLLSESFENTVSELDRFRNIILPGYKKEVDVRLQDFISREEFEERLSEMNRFRDKGVLKSSRRSTHRDYKKDRSQSNENSLNEINRSHTLKFNDDISNFKLDNIIEDSVSENQIEETNRFIEKEESKEEDYDEGDTSYFPSAKNYDDFEIDTKKSFKMLHINSKQNAVFSDIKAKVFNEINSMKASLKNTQNEILGLKTRVFRMNRSSAHIGHPRGSKSEKKREQEMVEMSERVVR